MSENILLVKNMVCTRCVSTVESILSGIGINYQHVLIGEIHLLNSISSTQKDSLIRELKKVGFELIASRTGGLIEKVKQQVILKARNEVSLQESKMNLSSFLSSKLNYEYSHLSNLFSSVEGRTIENYFIEQRIEKAKELIVYGQKSLSEIAFELDYSSAAHLSSQFKKITGLTPSHFREIGAAKRKSLDRI